MAGQSFPWSVPFAVAEIPDKGVHVKIEAAAAEREAIAALAGLRDLGSLAADFHIVPASRGRIYVTGYVTAQVGQNCVVTLEPVESAIDEEVDVFFAPEEAASSSVPTHGGSDDQPIEEPPEPIVGGRIDLGHLATEWLILGIDPYPRKAGVAFEPVVEANDPEDHPFAALAKLKVGDSGVNPPKNKRKSPPK